MNGSATVVTSSGLAISRAIDPVMAAATILPNHIRGKAGPTDDVGLQHYLRVTPEEPQELVWLTPQVGIDYTIEASTNLNWKIR